MKGAGIMKETYVAGGCFWGVEEYYKRLKGIETTTVGYVNGIKDDLSYEEVRSQQYEAIECVYLTYDEKQISLEKILEHLFRFIDPTSLDKQDVDEGKSYRVGTYYINDEQAKIMNDFVDKQRPNYDKEVVFEVMPMVRFTNAEDYHQDYLMKNPTGFCHVDFKKINDDEKK